MGTMADKTISKGEALRFSVGPMAAKTLQATGTPAFVAITNRGNSYPIFVTVDGTPATSENPSALQINGGYTLTVDNPTSIASFTFSIYAAGTTEIQVQCDTISSTSTLKVVQSFNSLVWMPATGVDGVLYRAKDSNRLYVWNGISYTEVSPTVLGETAGTAFRGDYGKMAFDHSQVTSGNPHNTTKSDIGLGNTDNTSDINKPISSAMATALAGKADLDGTGHVPASQLPSYVDDILDYTTASLFPATGEAGKIYVDDTTNLAYRWSGSQYVRIDPSIALGTTSSTAFRGDYGQAAFDHSQATGNPHGATTANVNDSTDRRYMTDAQRMALHAAVTVTDGATIHFVLTGQGITAEVKDGSLGYAKIQNVSATDKLLGRQSQNAGPIEEIICTAAARSLLDDATIAAMLATLGAAASTHGHSDLIRAVERLDNAAPPTGVNNQEIQDGWAYIVGNNSAKITKTITFPYTFDVGKKPLIFVQSAGQGKATSAGVPADANDVNSNADYISGSWETASETGFTARLERWSGTFTSSYYYLLHWYAIGTKARS